MGKQRAYLDDLNHSIQTARQDQIERLAAMPLIMTRNALGRIAADLDQVAQILLVRLNQEQDPYASYGFQDGHAQVMDAWAKATEAWELLDRLHKDEVLAEQQGRVRD